MSQTSEWVRLIPLLLLGFITMPPAIMILKKTGLSRWWALLVFFPIGYIPFAWMLAFRHWPAVDRVDYEGIFGDGGSPMADTTPAAPPFLSP